MVILSTFFFLISYDLVLLKSVCFAGLKNSENAFFIHRLQMYELVESKIEGDGNCQVCSFLSYGKILVIYALCCHDHRINMMIVVRAW